MTGKVEGRNDIRNIPNVILNFQNVILNEVKDL